MIPLFIVSKIDKFELVPKEYIQFCNEVWDTAESRQIYDVFLVIVMFAVPGCFVTVSYWRIGCQLWSEGHQLYKQESDITKLQGEKVMLSRRKVARMLVILAILFAICWMPSHLLSLYLDFASPEAAKLGIQILPFCILFGHANSALNPILYCFMNKSFRRYVSKMLRCTKRRNMNRQESPVSRIKQIQIYMSLLCVCVIESLNESFHEK